ncbi:MAG: LytTR family DNA-binding domain-containing protein [Coriobacteriia bacterium]|nr:LytTR family DNA-binding domain-containing protein [Coriobacteriia bacterium]MCL2750200.1 LytTR family DNA-binding domain-containing protein [Coriobacteriia bacterium]
MPRIEKPPLRLAICEDTDPDLAALKTLIENSGVGYTLDVFKNGESFIDQFAKDKYDLVFLDVFMDELSGVETAEKIREMDTNVVIVFTTTSEDFTREGYRLNAYKYMIKPVLKEDVEESLELAGVRRDRHLEASLEIISDGQAVSIPFNDIEYVESRDSRSHIITSGGEEYPTITSLDSLETLLTPPRFLRSHRAFIVNLDHVDDIDDDFIMDNGDIAYIRVKDHRRIKNKYDDYIFSKIRSD